MRLAGLWLPIFATTQIGAFSTAIPLTLALLAGIGSGSVKYSNLIKEVKVHKFKVVALLAVPTFTSLLHHSGDSIGLWLGWAALLTSILVVPSQLIAVVKPAPSAWQAQLQTSLPSPLIRTAKDSAYSADAGCVSLAMTAILYITSPSPSVLHGTPVSLLVLALASAVAVVYFTRSTHFHTQTPGPLAASCAIACFFSLFIDPSVLHFLLYPGASALCLGASLLDRSASQRSAHKGHEHSHHGNHKRNQVFWISSFTHNPRVYPAQCFE